MNPLVRAVTEYRALFSTLPLSQSASYLANSLIAAPAILSSRTLKPADWRMKGTYDVRYRGQRFVIPVGRIDQLLAGTDDSATFAAMREMFGGDVYLRRFRNVQNRFVVDLGANRGFFMLVAAKVMGADAVSGIEPEGKYDAVFSLLREQNDVAADRVHRYQAFAAREDGPGNISLGTIMDRGSFDRIDFLKCDIEGGEFDVFGDVDGLDRCGDLAVELHPWGGDRSNLVEAIRARGFEVVTTDQHGRDCPAEQAEYLYASSRGNLVV